MDKSNVEIVVSRYNEDIKWTERYKQFVTIYNKGNDLIDNAISLINVGREAHTYLHHIVHNYDNLADYTCFLQGDPIPHIHHSRSTEILDNIIKNFDTFPSFFWISEAIGKTRPTVPNMLLAYKRIFGRNIPHEIVFGQGAQFAVSKDLIKSRPCSFYKNILDIFIKESIKDYDYFMEFFWGEVFKMKEKCAIFTTVKNESIFLPIWLRHYQQYFDNQDIYVLDHHSTDGSTQNLPVNVRLVSNDYVNDHEWLAVIAQDFQKELLEKYECVIFAESDEILYSLNKPFNLALEDFIQSEDQYVTLNGFSVAQNIQYEFPIQPGDRIFEKRNFWYKDFREDKTLITKVPLEWNWGFHTMKNLSNTSYQDFYIAHLHRFDFETMVKRHQERTSFLQKNDGSGHHWKTDRNDVFEVFQSVAAEPVLIPQEHKRALQNLTY